MDFSTCEGEWKRVGGEEQKEPTLKIYVTSCRMLILANKEKPVAEKANRPQEIIITYSNVTQLAVGGSFRSDKNPKSRDCCCCFFSLLLFSLPPPPSAAAGL